MSSVVPCGLPAQRIKLTPAAPVIVCRKAKPPASSVKSSNRGWTHLLQNLREGAMRLNGVRGGHSGPTQGHIWTSYMPAVSDADLVQLWRWSCKNTPHNWAPYPELGNKDPPRLSLDKRLKETRAKVPGVKMFKERDQERRKGQSEDDRETFTSLETMLTCIFGRHRVKSGDVSVKGVKQVGRRNAEPHVDVKSEQPKSKKRKKKFQWRAAWLRLQGRLSKRFDQELCRIDQDRKETYLLKTQHIFQADVSIETAGTKEIPEDVTKFLNGHRRKLENLRQSGPQRLFEEQVRQYVGTLEKLAVSSRGRQLSTTEIFVASAVCHCLDRGRLVSEQYWFRILDFLNDSDFASHAVVMLIYTFNKAFGIDDEKYFAYTDLRDVIRLKHGPVDDELADQEDELEEFEGKTTTLVSMMESFLNPYLDFSESRTPQQADVRSSHLDTSVPPRSLLERPPRAHPFSIPCHSDTSTWPTSASCAEEVVQDSRPIKKTKLRFLDPIVENGFSA